MAKKNSGFMGGLAVGAVVTILLGSILAEYWLYGESPTATLQPEAGGMQLVETPAPAQLAAPVQETASDSPTPNPFVPGRQAMVVRNVRLYADASQNSLVLNLITKGETVTLTEPGGNYDNYPVEKEGQSWVRVRSEDGLVGWINSENLEIK